MQQLHHRTVRNIISVLEYNDMWDFVKETVFSCGFSQIQKNIFIRWNILTIISWKIVWKSPDSCVLEYFRAFCRSGAQKSCVLPQNRAFCPEIVRFSPERRVCGASEPDPAPDWRRSGTNPEWRRQNARFPEAKRTILGAKRMIFEQSGAQNARKYEWSLFYTCIVRFRSLRLFVLRPERFRAKRTIWWFLCVSL